MDIIPVIDLRGGEVVRAKKGERHLYAPIRTPLSPTSRPADVVAGFLALHPFRTIYVADLDAIEGKGSQSACLVELEAAFPALTFWVDAGIATSCAATSWLKSHRGDLVLGSETMHDAGLVARISTLPRSLLSLDFRGDAFQGPARLAEDETLWPTRLIVMSLARIGSQAGPDFDRLAEIRVRSRGRHAIYAAGGIRGPEDLKRLNEAGVAGVLLASALHDGRITTRHLRKDA